MRIKIILLVLLFIGMIIPQHSFRKMAYLTQSVGTHIYNHAGASTNVQAEVTAYNTAHGYTGENACTINLDPTSPDDYPTTGNQIWHWADAFEDKGSHTFKETYLDTDVYEIIMIKHCAASQSGIWFYWYEGPQDTINFPETQSYYNYQWYVRKILTVMEQYPEKFFVWWNIPSATEEESPVADMVRLEQFNTWMTDTLQAGLDSYGAFPPNVKIFDYFNLLVNPSTHYMRPIYRDAPLDYHPNAIASELVAPIFVQQAFNAAINYEINYPLPVELSTFYAKVTETSIMLHWRTATEVNNYGFDIERNGEKIGFVTGNGNSNSPNDYMFEDIMISDGKYNYRLKQLDTDGHFSYSDYVNIDFISRYKTECYPNPFNGSIIIPYRPVDDGIVNIKIYTILGKEVSSIEEGQKLARVNYRLNYTPEQSSSGVYLVRVYSNNKIITTYKILYMK